MFALLSKYQAIPTFDLKMLDLFSNFGLQNYLCCFAVREYYFFPHRGSIYTWMFSKLPA